ncbi:hypothetical protein FNT36_24785 [Hymenobacter setariae]|uniref:Uncharacterized protein n=1 Tax=Hymenobacter setariae TaxID=2594794 RepID=A0A558BJP7_9BACT|nr:hypothetical protein [Hymenobacter setariae]TVT36732.1 hypothetical protein FNT36_24785 [Hymenobacter setariae]
MDSLPEYAAPTGIRSMLYQMAELLLYYPDEAQRVAAAEALPTPNTFLAEAPDLETVAEWLQFTGEDVSADELRERFKRQGWLVRRP